MPDSPPFDQAQAHHDFSAHCFNAAWALLDKSVRTAAEDEQMLLLAQASLWHWTQRADQTSRNLSVGYWQLARIYAMLNRPLEAQRAGEECLRQATNEPPFYVGYAHEALARAAWVAGDKGGLGRHLAEGRRLAALVTDDEERQALEADLAGVGAI